MLEKVKKYYRMDARKVALLLAVLLVFLAYFWVQSRTFLTYKSDAAVSDGQLPELLEGQEVVQEVFVEKDGLLKIGIPFRTNGRVNFCTVSVSLLSEDGRLIQTWNIKGSLLQDNSYYTVELDRPLKKSRGQTCFLKITSDAKTGSGVSIGTRSEGAKAGLTLNGAAQEREICLQLTYRQGAGTLFSGANGFHAVVLIVLSCLLVLLLPALSRLKTEYSFLAIWLLLGAVFLYSLPLFRAPDEDRHFYRACEVSFRQWVSDTNADGVGGSFLPMDGVELEKLSSDWQTYSENKDLQKISKGTVFEEYPNIALYSPVSFLPQAAGIFLARHVTESVAAIAYAGRIFNWIFITAILFLAIRILPVGKEVAALVALMPMNIQESVSLAPDGQVVAVSLLIVALIVRLRHGQEDRMSAPQLVLLYVLAFLISQLKIVYLPFGLLYFLIPWERFGSRKKKLLHILLMAALAVGAGLGWLYVCRRFLTTGGTDAGAQLSYIARNPIDYLYVLLRTVFEDGGGCAELMVGSLLGALSIPTVTLFVLLYLCVLFSRFSIQHRKQTREEIREDMVFGLVNVLLVLLIYTSLYLQWVSPFADKVIGVQGRYFIPLLLPLFFSLHNPSVLLEDGEKKNCLSLRTAAFLVMVNVCAGASIFFASVKPGV